jgi:hypothetical protein
MKMLLWLVVCLMFLPVVSVGAGDQTLSVNGNNQNDVWFISGEASLVMNGFDLNASGIVLPATIDRVSIAVNTPTPGVPVEVVIYQDANGGSPADATLAGRTQVDISQAGTFTATFSPPVTVTQPAVWVGFYLPVDFRFLGDTSGSSVLTYWAWTANGRFDVANLASAQVIGPADGSAPVNIDMGGKARITLEITGAGGSAGGTPLVAQTIGAANVNLSYLRTFVECPALMWDTDDEYTSYLDNLNVHCREVASYLSPADPDGYVRRGALYDMQFYQQSGIVSGRLNVAAVTHCIRPAPEDLDRAVIGNAFGFPRTWRILPTQRFGDIVCAEIRRGGNLSYFVPG